MVKLSLLAAQSPEDTNGTNIHLGPETVPRLPPCPGAAAHLRAGQGPRLGAAYPVVLHVCSRSRGTDSGLGGRKLPQPPEHAELCPGDRGGQGRCRVIGREF